jgi:signal transduction histidine kinase
MTRRPARRSTAASTRPGGNAARDPSRVTRAVAGIAAATICAAAAAVAWWSFQELVDEVTARDRETAAALAEVLLQLPEDERPAAVPAMSGGAVIALISADGSASPPDLGAELVDARWQRWVTRVVREAELNQRFTIRDPAGTQWRYVTAPMPDGSTVLLGRPDGTDLSIPAIALRTTGVVLVAVVLLVALAWPLVRRGFLRPLDSLIEASEDLRFRGEVRPADRAWVDRLARRGDHVGRLARSLTAVEQDISWRLLQLSTLLETIRAVGASLDTTEVFERILGQLRRLFAVERCGVLSLDQRANVFVIRASLGLSDEFVREIQVDVSEPHSPSMRALRSGEPVQVSDTETDLSFAAFALRARRFDYRSVLAIPLATSMAPPSTLLLYRSEPYRYSYSELELAMSVARFASIAMENAALYRRIDERLQEQTRRLEAIIESLDDGLILAGLDGVVSYHNAAAAALLGGDGRQLAGVPVADVFRRFGLDPPPAGGPGQASSRELTATIHGKRRDLRLRTFTVADEHGAALGRGYLWQDITSDRVVERLKSSLLATASHELRTPLATIKGYVSTLLAEDIEWDRSQQREFLATISSETDRLTALMGSLLDLSRIEAGALVIRPEAVAVRDLVDRAVAGLSPAGRQRLRLDVRPGTAVVELDRARIETAVRNLADNALKFSSPPARVDIVARCVRGELTITVRDRGVGVPEDLRDRIFDRFVRGDDGLARKAGGFGLGLAICRGFVEAHGGRVWSRVEQPGTSFTLTVPVRRRETG